jgi:hypothetical protein
MAPTPHGRLRGTISFQRLSLPPHPTENSKKSPNLMRRETPVEFFKSLYSLRMWIECGFKQTKRAGWQWQATRMEDPARAARFWLALAVATLWVVSVGGEAEETLPASSFDELPPTHIARRNCRTTARSRPRLVSCFRRGRLIILTALLIGQSLPRGSFSPEPWPESPELQWATPEPLEMPDIQRKEADS